MTFRKQLPLLASAIFCLSFAFASGQTAAPATSVAPAAAMVPSVAQLSEDDLKARYAGKFIFLRESYMGEELNFDMDGKVKGSPAAGSFTLSALKVTKVNLSKHKLEIEADRYGLHFLAAVPYEDNSKSFDKVKISKKPVHITIERELVVIPKVKKEKKRSEANPQQMTAQTAPTPAEPTAGAVSPAHSAMLLNKALDSVFASDIDSDMLARLPDYWREYFNSQSKHRAFMPADAAIKMVGDGVAAPKVLNTIDPTSNEYAQQFGIAGMDVLRTVVDATGVPRQIAIDRPIGFGLDEKAVEAVKNSRFRPAVLNGQPVPVVIDLVVTFRIYSSGTQPGSVVPGTRDAVLAASVGESGGSLNR